MVWVASVDHKHGTNLYAAATQPGIWALLADYCREWWDKDGPKEPLAVTLSDQKTVEAYFAWMAEIGGSEGYTISEVGLFMSDDEANALPESEL
jgi:hypothetical protein